MSTALIEVKNHYPLADVSNIAVMFAKSSYFGDASETAQAFTKIMAGQELGIPPVAAMRDIYIVKGKVSLAAVTIAAIIKRSGKYDYRIKEHTDDKCVLIFKQKNGNTWEDLGESQFTIEDAKKANLLTSQAWKSYPRNMLFARALSNGARWHTPEIFSGGVYTPDELDDSYTADIEGNIVQQAKVNKLKAKLEESKEAKVVIKDEIVETEVTEVKSDTIESLAKEVTTLWESLGMPVEDELKALKIKNLTSLDIDSLKVIKRNLLIKKNNK